ncbi:MAG: serine protein kinase PrkA [Planctomycetota bacterium]|nr:MAG: serine protein kinase PrkA [Planctomycetota bacterium]
MRPIPPVAPPRRPATAVDCRRPPTVAIGPDTARPHTRGALARAAVHPSPPRAAGPPLTRRRRPGEARRRRGGPVLTDPHGAGTPSLMVDPFPAARGRPRDMAATIERVSEAVGARFRERQMVKSFAELLEDLFARPRVHTRNAAQYLADMIEAIGTEPGPDNDVGVRERYRVFDAPFAQGRGRVFGQGRPQAELVKYIRYFAERGRVDKLLMLHGPNGSAKSSMLECLLGGLEAYSRTDEGALYALHWVFSDALERDRLGFAQPQRNRRTDTYAYMEPEEITCRIPCELRDNPLLLLPREQRRALIEQAYRDAGLSDQPLPEHLLEGALCPKCRQIYDTLLTAYHGDWRRVVQHVQVERFFISRRYRSGAITIEPQRNVDATARPINPEARHQVPPVLRNITLLEPAGDLIDANRGMVVYSDFFKRPLEVHKYLLTTIERNTVTLPGLVAYLDLVMTATANEKNLCLFKRDPDFASFKARIELIKVPYLLNVSEEARIYEQQLAAIGRDKHVAPHTAYVTALWAVLTRLRRPRAKNYPGTVGNLVSRLTPLQKAMFYDRREVPADFSEAEKRELLAHYEDVRSEFDDAEEEFEGLLDAAYEGRRGASPREMLMLLADAAARAEFPCLSPLAVLRSLRELVKDVSVYDFLRITPQAGYNDCPHFIEDVEQAYFERVEQQINDALELVPAASYTRLFDDYFEHVRAFVREQRVVNPQTGEREPPDERLMRRVEQLVGIQEEPAVYRRDLVRRIAAFAIGNPGRPLVVREIFDDIFAALRAGFYREQEEQIERMLLDLLRFGTEEWSALTPQRQRQVEHAMQQLIDRHGFCERCAKEAIAFVLKRRLA